MVRRLMILILLGGGIAAAVLLWGLANARADPVVRRATIALPHWPRGAPPVQVALISDIHIGSVVMDGARLRRIVPQVNRLGPDLVLLAGDFVAGHNPAQGRAFAARLTGPLSLLDARLGVVAVPGNHDHWTDLAAVRSALDRAGVKVVANGAVARGPLAIIGIDDAATGNDSLPIALAARRRIAGAPLLVTHSPDLAPRLPAGGALLLAGHTHCGQIVVPWWGPIAVPSAYGDRYRCGIVREGGRLVIVTGGVGTSVVPLRFGAPPDLWLITVGPARRGVSRARS
ncbi:metallophosphoesterase [Sphingomonas sp.]|uniref:metallophosphoesterase n=1 Tax=Sphingomonas sp. TaxID=28214 RepID=UPI002BC1E417|nr:metallophosphoesterase [Sphingomonas sp.]HWK35395.1 metallophosphoesterase [Sphingomonas sp.]